MPASKRSEIIRTLQRLEEQIRFLPQPMGDLLVAYKGRDPFMLLIACVLSQRARDSITYPIVLQLFERIHTPHELLAMPLIELEQLLKPLGVNRSKARTLHAIARKLIDRHQGIVPEDEGALLELPGVGPKTAAFVLSYAWGHPALCVDTHVHRLANKFKWVRTKTTAATEKALKALVPSFYWNRVNRVLVTWGQQVCKPRLKFHRSGIDIRCPCSK